MAGSRIMKADYGDFGPHAGVSMVTKRKSGNTKAMKKHPGFKAVQKKVAAKQGVSMDRAGAIVAAGARKASKKAVSANPRLKRVSGVVKKGKK